MPSVRSKQELSGKPLALKLIGVGLALSGAGVMSAGLSGCRGDRSEKPPRQFFPDMDDQPKWQPQSESEFFANNRAQRTPEDNTVAFGTSDFDPTVYADESWAMSFMEDRADLLKEGDEFYLGTSESGVEGWITTMPAEVTREMLELGRDRFAIYCTPCHGGLGNGQGSVGVRWAYMPANLTGDIYKDRTQKQGTDGWLFNVVRNGVWGPDGSNKMPGYAHAIDEGEAWAVVAYIRALQASQGATIEDVPSGERQELIRQGGTPTSAGDEADAAASGDETMTEGGAS